MRNESQRQPTAPETPELAVVLAAARRAETPDADDERRATAAFRAARDGGAHAVRSPWWRRRDDWRPVTSWRGRRPARIMLGGFVVAATLGGVAVAAGGGVLPTPFRGGEKGGPADSVHPTPGSSRTPEGHRSDAGGPTTGGDGSGRTETNGPGFVLPPGRTGAPGGTRAEAALCRVYAKDLGKGKAADSTAFDRLAAAAGEESEAAVTAYCETLLDRPVPGPKDAADEPGNGNADGEAEQDGPVPPRGVVGGLSAGAAGVTGAADGGPDASATGGRNGAAVG